MLTITVVLTPTTATIGFGITFTPTVVFTPPP